MLRTSDEQARGHSVPRHTLTVLLCALSLLPAAARPTGEPLPIQVLPRLELASSVDDAPAALRRAWSVPLALRRGGREVQRCTDAEGHRARDFASLHEQEFHALEERLLRCRAVQALLRAQPSRTSFVRDLLTMKSPGAVLPAAMVPTYQPPKPLPPQTRSWLAADPRLQFEQGSGPYDAFSLDIHGRVDSGRLEWWATGDFNADGQEDVLAFLVMGPEQGSLLDVSVFLLTRSQPQGVLQVLEQWK